MFGFGSKKKGGKAADALAAFDALLEDLGLQAAEVRKSAATLSALKGELGRTEERLNARQKDLFLRLREAGARNDAQLVGTLQRDQLSTAHELEATQETLAKAQADAKLLLDIANHLRDDVEKLKVERTSASARLAAGHAVYGALREKADRVRRVLAVDAARDEVERAHALAEIYREEKAGE